MHFLVDALSLKFLGGWVHSVNFSSSGDRIAWVGHDSSISVADASKGMAVSVIRTDFLPFLACLWVSENRLIAAVLRVKRMYLVTNYQWFFNIFFLYSTLIGTWLLPNAF